MKKAAKGQLISEAISLGFSEANDIFEEILLWPLKWVKKTNKIKPPHFHPNDFRCI